MKFSIIPSFRRPATILLIAVGCTIANASTVVFSNLVADNGGGMNRLSDSEGLPLAAGCWIQLGSFGGLNPAEIQALVQQGKQSLLAAFSPIGAASTMGSGAASMAGRIEFAGSTPLSQRLTGLHVVVFNAATPSAATEVLVAALPGSVPADDPSGLPGYIAVHLDAATPVVGAAGAGGLSTAVVVGKFDAWMSGQNDGAVSANLLLPGADADQDGQPNLIEYALGSQAGDGASRADTELVEETDVIRLRFLGRNDDTNLSLVVETCAHPDLNHWSQSSSLVSEMESPPSTAPVGYTWYETFIPKSGARMFARVRVVLNP